jgi:DNA repair photolyase
MTETCSSAIEIGAKPKRIGELVELFAPICPTMWSVTPYGQCDIRCIYCCTGVQGPSNPLIPVDLAVAETDRMLAEVAPEDLLIFGAFSDAYPTVEATHGLTRVILERVVDRGRRFSMVTKGTTILRDLDLLRRAPEGTLVQVSICSTDDAALARLDPNAPSATERFAAIDVLHDAGVNVELNALPYIPDVSDLEAMFARLPSGVGAVVSPLAFGAHDQMRLLGRTYTRDEVWARYLAEHERIGHLPGVSWVRPSLEPTENMPLYRLPSAELQHADERP